MTSRQGGLRGDDLLGNMWRKRGREWERVWPIELSRLRICFFPFLQSWLPKWESAREREREKAYQKLRLEAMNFKERRGLIDSKKLKQKTTSLYIYKQPGLSWVYLNYPDQPNFIGPNPNWFFLKPCLIPNLNWSVQINPPMRVWYIKKNKLNHKSRANDGSHNTYCSLIIRWRKTIDWLPLS